MNQLQNSATRIRSTQCSEQENHFLALSASVNFQAQITVRNLTIL